MRLFLALLLALAFVAPARGESLKVILLLEHEGASPFNNLMRAGLEKARAEFGAIAETLVAPRGERQAEIFREAARRADLVIVATDGLHEILRDNAGNFRRVMFGCVDAGVRARNIMSVTFADEQAAYIAGAVAAMLAGNKPLAWLSGEDTPALRSLYNGFVEGARLTREDIRVAQAVSGSFTDPQAAVAKARALLERDPAVVALASGLGNEAAAGELGERPIVAFDAPDPDPRVLGSVVKALDRAVYEITASAASGNFAAKEIRVYDLANGGVDFVLGAAARKTPDVARRATELRRELIRGAIRPPSLRQRTLCDCLD